MATLTLTAVSCVKEKKPTYDQLLDEHEKNNSAVSAIYGILVFSVLIYIGYKVGTFKTTNESPRKNKFDQMTGNGSFTKAEEDEDDFHPTV